MSSHCTNGKPVMMAPSSSRRWMGSTSASGSDDRITPAACTPVPRVSPSMPRAVSRIRLTSGSSSYRARSSPASLYRSWAGSKIPDSGISLPMTAAGNTLVIRSPIAYG
jgi:hypothetical protein